MNSEQEDLELVRKLLALKKYEQPPPRYFNELPGQIWMRIERDSGSDSVSVSFWRRIFPNVGLNPAIAYSFGLLACGTLFFGVVYSLNTEDPQVVAEPIIKNMQQTNVRFASENEIGMQLAPYHPTQIASTNPVLNAEPLPSLFTGMNLRVEPVSYAPVH